MQVLAVVMVNALVPLAITGEATVGPHPTGALVLAVGEPVMALAAGDDVVVAVTDLGEVLLLDGEGLVRRRLRVPAGHPTSGQLPRAGRLASGNGRGSRMAGRDGFAIEAGVPADDDFNDPYEVDSEVEDPTNVLLEDGPSQRRAGRPLAASGGPLVVAAGGRTAWLAGPDGLQRTSLDSSEPLQRVGGSSAEEWSTLAASADGHWLAGVRGGWLARSGDGGETFDAIAPVASPGQRLAVTNEGDIIFVDREGARRIGSAPPHAVWAWPTALDACAGRRDTVMLLGGGVAIIDSTASARNEVEGTTVEQVALPEDANRLACDGSATNLAAGGTSLWTSSDAGRTWSRRSELPPGAAATLAVARGAVWVATRDGLWRVPIESPNDTSRAEGSSGERRAGEPDTHAPPPPRPAHPIAPFIDLSLDARQPSWWATALPRVDLAFTWATAIGRRDVRALVLLSFAIGRESGRALMHRRLMRQVLQRRTELGSAALALSTASPIPLDPIDRDERDALVRILEAPHE